jgi:CBS domain-containing membrane protein
MRRIIKRQYRLAKIVVAKETDFDVREHVWTFLGSFAGIALIGFFNATFLNFNDNIFLIGSFGASSVLIYGLVDSPLAQPRNLVGGHLICGFVGVTVNYLVPELWLASSLAVSLSIVGMQITKTVHPPGGATALIAVIGSEKIKALGYFYLVSPILSGVTVLLIIALLMNNISGHRRYPRNPDWYKLWKRRYV